MKKQQVLNNSLIYLIKSFLEFFVACIIVGLEYLHQNNIIHRDIKPENLVLDDKGYVRITDLGIARMLKAENSNDTSGTPGYMGILLNFIISQLQR
jgi:serine/threonine protein kinase